MAGVTGVIVTKFRTRRALRTSLANLNKAYQEVAPIVEKEIKATINQQTGRDGPPSPPGTPPFKRTGRMRMSVSVTGSAKRGLVVRTNFYGRIHEQRRDRFQRPFIQPVLGAQRTRWQKELADRALKHQGKTTKRRSRRRR